MKLTLHVLFRLSVAAFISLYWDPVWNYTTATATATPTIPASPPPSALQQLLPLENVQCICAALHKFSVEICIKSTLTRAIRKQATSFPTDRQTTTRRVLIWTDCSVGTPPLCGVGRADLEICYKLVQRTNVAILSTHVCSRLFVVSAFSLTNVVAVAVAKKKKSTKSRQSCHAYIFIWLNNTQNSSLEWKFARHTYEYTNRFVQFSAWLVPNNFKYAIKNSIKCLVCEKSTEW